MPYQLDEGFVGLGHDGQRWAIHDQSGRIVASNDAFGAGDHAGARAWLLDVVKAGAVVPEHVGDAAVSYVLEPAPEGLAATPIGSFHFDGQGWVVTDERGQVVHRNDTLAEDDYEAALAWADSHGEPRRRRTWRSRLRVNVGQFPDGSYGDPDGRLGRQRLRRAWNRLLA